MINLLTKEGQEKLLREYRRRRLVVACFLLSVIWLAGLVTVGALVYQIHQKQTETDEALNRVALEPNANAGTQDSLQETNADIATLKKSGTSRPALAELWQSVLKDKPNSVKITDWRWGIDTKTKVTKLELVGRSSTRQALLDFIEKLKQNKTFTTVDSPISNLIKNRDLDFTITLTIKEIKQNQHEK